MQKWLRQMGIELVRSVENEIMYGIGFQEIILLFIFFVIPSVVGYKLAQIKNRNVVFFVFYFSTNSYRLGVSWKNTKRYLYTNTVSLLS